MGEVAEVGVDSSVAPIPRRKLITPVHFEDWNEGSNGQSQDKAIIYCSTQLSCYEKIDKMNCEVNNTDASDERGTRGWKRPRYCAFSQEITFGMDQNRKAVGREDSGKPIGRTSFRYLVATYLSMSEECKRQQTPSYYEMIRDGHPCHLYFDLEYQKEHNEGLKGYRMVDELVAKLDGFLWKCLGLKLQESFILELDSTTATKFSRHLVIRFPRHAFKDNTHVKVLVNTFLESLGPNEFKVKSKNGTADADFVDRSVYSRNRNFRMMYNSKAGRNVKLVPTRRFSMAKVQSVRTSFAKLFNLGLICNVEEGVQLLTCDMFKTDQRLIENFTKKDHKICFQKWNVIGSGIVKSIVGSRSMNEVPVKVDKEVVLDEKFVKSIRGLIPYMEKIAEERSGKHAWVNSIRVLGWNSELVSYGFLGDGSHYCENVGRNHERNHIHLLVNIPSRQYCQKCFDIDCSGFSSVWRPL